MAHVISAHVTKHLMAHVTWTEPRDQQNYTRRLIRPTDHLT